MLNWIKPSHVTYIKPKLENIVGELSDVQILILSHNV